MDNARTSLVSGIKIGDHVAICRGHFQGCAGEVIRVVRGRYDADEVFVVRVSFGYGGKLAEVDRSDLWGPLARH